MSNARGESKKRGAKAAREWRKRAKVDEQIALAASQFEYGNTLTDLIADEYDVPESEDVDFSWGFFKQIKGAVHHAIKRPPAPYVTWSTRRSGMAARG